MKKFIPMLLLIALCSSTSFAAGWKDSVNEQATVDPGDIFYIENAAADTNYWLSALGLEVFLEDYLATIDDPTFTTKITAPLGDFGTASATQGNIGLYSNASAFVFRWLPGATTEDMSFRLPPSPSGGANYLLNVDADGTMDYTDPASLGGGNVSNSGTPTVGQTAVWVTATTIEGVDTVTAGTVGEAVLISETASAAQQAMDVEVGVDVQAWDTDLDSWALISPSSKQDTLTIISGTSAMATASIASGACAITVTTTATGAATTDVISGNFNASPLAVTGYAASTDGGLFIYAWPTANNVNFSVCNNTSSAIVPGAVTLNWQIIK